MDVWPNHMCKYTLSSSHDVHPICTFTLTVYFIIQSVVCSDFRLAILHVVHQVILGSSLLTNSCYVCDIVHLWGFSHPSCCGRVCGVGVVMGNYLFRC